MQSATRVTGESFGPPALMKAFRGAFLLIGALSGVINIFTLTGSIFMLSVYDRVLPSRSVPTLVSLGIIAACAYLFMGMMEAIRSRVLARVGMTVEESLNLRLFDVMLRQPLRSPVMRDNLAPLRDLDQVRTFMASPGPTALFDIPWMPIYLVICFLFHPAIGITVVCGALVLVMLTILTEVVNRGPAKASQVSSAARASVMQMSRRNAEAIVAMGMSTTMAARWLATEQTFARQTLASSDIAVVLSNASRIFRMMLQSFTLAVGAYLVLKQEATGGVMIASSILSARALAPMELAIANWRGFVGARQSWQRLTELLGQIPPEPVRVPLPAPSRKLTVTQLSVAPPETQRVVLADVSFELAAGSALGVIGPSASGKSSLARALVGLWSPIRGTVRLDGAAIDQWAPDVLGKHIGYVPQEVELLSGTIAENVSRFDPRANGEDLIAAAVAAGVHEMIVKLPDGYQTPIGEGGAALSGGQRQRIALARALYKNPFMLVLDEPNSNLDAEGEQALHRAIETVRARGGIVVVIAHRPALLACVDKVLMLRNGVLHAFGPRDEVLSRFLVQQGPAVPRPAPVVDQLPQAS